jgi:hypothetical protein
MANAEFIIPIACFALSLAALWISQVANLKPQTSCLLLAAVLLLDVASYGHFFHWRIATFNVNHRLSDPPAVQVIKAREGDFNSFRVMSYPVQAYDYVFDWPEDPNYELINAPNISILRGLQSISGYDVLRPVRVGEMIGASGASIHGYLQDLNSFKSFDRGFDLLNVKYLIAGYGGATGKKVGHTYEGVYFARTNFGMEFKPGVKLTTEAGGAPANEIALVSMLANSTHLPDGAPILKFRLHTRDHRVIECELQAGRDTSEWAYDRADVRANIKHRRAAVVESQKVENFASHLYLGRLKFDRAEVERIEWIYAREDALLYLVRASLHDSQTGVSTPLSPFYLPPERWRKLADLDQIEVYENLQMAPRAWFVQNLIELPREHVIKTIRTGLTPDGERFDPLKTAMVEKEDAQKGVVKNYDSGGASDIPQAQVIDYRPNHIEIETHRPEEGFLVLSEIFYHGWKAYIDGKEQAVIRTDYVLRGINVPPGDHKVEFIYRPRSFRNGLLYALPGLALLILIHPRIRIRALSEIRSRN